MPMPTYTDELIKSEPGEDEVDEQVEAAGKLAARVRKWKGKIEDAVDSCNYWVRQTDESFDEYLAHAKRRPTGADLKEAGIQRDQSNYPLWWSSVRTVQPAIYSQTPVTVVKKVFDDMRDDVARLGSLCYERLSKYNMSCNPYDRVMYATRDMYIHSGRTTSRVLFDATFETKLEKKYFQQIQSMGPDGQPIMMIVDDQGQPFQDVSSLQQDEQGFYIEEEIEDVSSYGVRLQPVHYKDLVTDPSARIWEELGWIAFKSMLTKSEVTERFGEEKANKLEYKETCKEPEEWEQDQKIIPEKYAKVWEIWVKKTKEVLWYCDELQDEFLDERPDPYELLDFYPVPPFMLGTVGPDDMVPVPDYIQLRPLINQINGMFRRLRILIRSLRRRGLFDAAVPELQELAEFASEAEFIGIKNFQQIIGERSLEDIVRYFPTQEIAQAVSELSSALQEFENKFYELYGLPDILRGVSDPDETAAAQQMKGKFLSLRFSAVQREFQRLNRDCIEMMCDLALRKYPDEKLAEIMGVKFMKPEDQALFPQVLQLLKSDTQRMLRIDVETDSTITMNEVAEIEQRNYLAQTLFNGLSTISDMGAQNPAFLPLAAQVILYVVRGVRKGAEIEQTLEQTIEQMQQASQQPQQQAPDPGLQKAQIQAQVQTQKMQLDAQLGQAKLMLQQQDLQMKAQSLQVQMQKIAADSQNEQMRIALDKQIAELDTFIESSKLSLEKEYLGLDMQERYMTEQRLQRETDIKEIEATSAPESSGSSSSGGKAPAVNIVNVTPGSGGIF